MPCTQVTKLGKLSQERLLSAGAFGAIQVVCAGKEKRPRWGRYFGRTLQVAGIIPRARKEKNHPWGWFRRGPVSIHYSQSQVGLQHRRAAPDLWLPPFFRSSRRLEPGGIETR